ncbi:hypothetical protein QFC21_005973 [Naganishia friedmannii]|uniref:Uncharacterized protein n=1 Tax=Naganishia friedmannii TaxID=89922 RepID=A0ACC2V511_9TREE|nr:hypothetical protein QFC21_005973 [Naganishia friedmannii]
MATHRPSRYARPTTLREESPEIQALSPPIQTQELPPTAAVPRPRARRRGQNVEEQSQSQTAGLSAVTVPEAAPQQQQQPVATPIRSQPFNGINGSVSSTMNIKEQQAQPESSPMRESLPRRARIRHSLMPQDQSGKFTVRAGVMEERVGLILTVAQDAIETSMQFELDQMGEDRETFRYLTRVWDALDSNQTYIFNFERAPLFLSPETVAEDLMLEGAGHVNLFEAVPSLRHALALRNLANFLRIILGPDETVQRLLPQEPEMIDASHTEKLSLLYGYAWSALLRICVPRSKWTSRAAVGLLVDMATQRFLMGYNRWAEFEELDDEAVDELREILSDDGIRRSAYGDRDLWPDGEADESLQNLEREWQRAITIRLDTILGAEPRELDNLYPFNTFRHELVLQLESFLRGSEPLEGLLPVEHEALGAAVRERRSASGIELQEAEDIYQDDIVEDDDAAVDLLTQTQHVSGRSEQDQPVNMDSQQTQSQKQSMESLVDNTFPESVEMYETQVDALDIASQDQVGPSNAEEQDDDVLEIDESPNGSPAAVTPIGLAENDERNHANKNELEEEEREEEEQEELEEIETVETQPMAVDDEAPAREQTAELNDGTVEVVIDLEEDETLETQPSWNIRKGQNGPVASGNIIQEAANARKLNAPQADAVRLEWDESQQPIQGEGEEPAGSAEEEEEEVHQTGKATAKKRATPSPTPDVTEDSEDVEVNEKETRKQRQSRKGKAPVRPVRKAARAARHAVKSSKRLVSEDELSATQGSDYDDDSETDKDEAPVDSKSRKNASHTASKAVLSGSRTDVPAVRRSVKPNDRESELAGRKQIRYGQNVSFMDHYVDNDLFMADEDGEPLFDAEGNPLKEDPEYLAAVPNRKKPVAPKGLKPPKRLVWTEDDKLLLYREIQKCPINAKSAYVSAVLHRFGDWGCKGSDVFRLADSMNLRDQMRDLVKLRSDRDLPVLGNARFYLPTYDPRKKEFDIVKKGEKEEEIDPEEEQRVYVEALKKAAKEEKEGGVKVTTKATRKKRKRQAAVDAEEEEEDAQNDKQDAVEEEDEPEAEPTGGSRTTQQQSQVDEELDELEIEKEIGAEEAADDTASDIREEVDDEVAERPVQDGPVEEEDGDATLEPASPELEPEPAQKKQRVVGLNHPSS